MGTTTETIWTGAPGGLPAAIRQRAEAASGRTALTFVDYSGEPRGRARDVTYGELEARVRTVGERLRRLARPGDRAAILCPTGADYVVGFAACLYAGVIAVPLFPPDPQHRNTRRVAAAMEDCGCRLAVARRADREAAAGIPLSAPLQVLCPDETEPDPAAPWAPSPAEPGATAYLQYTSGSTRHPAGVRVTHHNMAVAAGQLATCLRFDERSVLVSWLPFFHDMGLVFAVTLPLIRGFRAVHLEPLDFIREPHRWLRLLSDYGGTHTMVPNFSLDLCTDRVPKEEREGLDLSRLAYLGCAAEPVRPAALARFTEAFAPCGFRPLAHSPGYGLAEATLPVTGIRPEEEPHIHAFDRAELNAGRVRRIADGDARGVSLVGCGTPLVQDVRIVHPETGRPAAAEELGEIWVRGENVCPGYWNGGESDDGVFGAVLDSGETAAPSWTAGTARAAGGTAAGCAPATSASSTAARCSSPAAARTSSSSTAGTTIRPTWS